MSFPIFLCFVALAVLAAGKVTIQGVGLRRYVNGDWEARRFTALMFAAVAMVLALLLRPALPSLETVAYGVVFGAMNAVFQLSYAQSLRSGPVSLTVLIVNLSLFLSVIFGIVYEHNPVSPWLAVGLVALVVSLVLSLKKDPNAAPVSGKWLLFVLLGHLSNFGSYVVQRLHKLSPVAAESDALLVIAMATAALLTAATLPFGARSPRKETPTDWKGIALCLLGIGVVLGGYQILQIWIIGQIPPTVFSPLLNGMCTCVNFLTGLLIFRDRLTRRQVVGFFVGVAAIASIALA